MVALGYRRDGYSKWRVMAFKGHRIELRRADRKHPDFALIKLADIRHTCSDTIKVYHPHGIGVGLRSWGEPPLKSGFAVAQLTSQGGALILCLPLSAGSYKVFRHTPWCSFKAWGQQMPRWQQQQAMPSRVPCPDMWCHSCCLAMLSMWTWQWTTPSSPTSDQYASLQFKP